MNLLKLLFTQSPNPNRPLVHGVLALATCLMATSSEAVAQYTGFRVDTDVTQGEDARPVQQSLTLFSNGVAYNLSQDSGELMVVDWQRDRIILLNKP